MAPFTGAPLLTENFDVEVIAPGTTPKKSSGGFAFEVQIKTPEKAQQHPDVRARLESYSTDCSSGDSGSETANKPNHRARGLSECLELAARQQERRHAHIALVAARAKEHVESVKTKTAALQQRRVEAMEAEKCLLEAAMAQKVAVSIANVAKRSSVAGEHNKVVEEKLNKHKEAVDTRQEAEKSRLEATMAQKVEVSGANVAKRSSLAGEHNKVVEEKLNKHKEAADIRQEAEKSRLEATMTQKVEVSSANVAKRSSLAGEHNKNVEEKLNKHREAVDSRLEAEKSRLEGAMAQKVEVGSANVAKRRSLAAQHNTIVHHKVVKQKEATHVRQKKILERHEKKRGSKIVGVPYSSVCDVSVATAAAPSSEKA